MDIIKVENVAKTFRGANGKTVEVLQSVSFAIPGPAMVGLLGPNGVGKSVTLRILAGLLEPDAGIVTINGKPPHDGRIGFAPASSPVFSWRRAINDIAIGMEQTGISRKERHRHVTQFMNRFSIDLPLNERINGFSSGQRQIANFARAFVGPHPPAVIILDEPLAALSPTVREEVLRYLGSVRESMLGVVFIAVHSLLDAARLCDWLIPLKERPVTINQNDLIRVNMPAPRSQSLATSSEFQQLLKQMETIYPAMAPTV
jgi:ABC-type nitrate/sulfonate/bicarbonate transport system ATPase subunit